jgi:hypothetical protein
MPSPVCDPRHPHRDFSSIIQIGIKVLNLALANKAAIEPRLPKGTLAALETDIAGLGPARADALQVRGDAQQATSQQMAGLSQSHMRVMSIRKALRVASAPVEVRRAYGVGTTVRKDSPTQVEAAIKQILKRVTDYPDEPASFGVLAEDIDALKAALGEVQSADLAQEQKRAKAPDATKARNRMANRILRAAQQISAAGMIAFVQQPDVWDEFAAIQTGVSESKKGEGKKAQAKASGEAPKAEPQAAAPQPAMPQEKPWDDKSG